VDSFDHQIEVDRDVRAWIDPGGGIMLLAAEPVSGVRGDPVEITSKQARDLGLALIRFADIEDAE
jgi:hypothetical protein